MVWGRACLIAADYGYIRVRGVDIVPEFCARARSNVEVFCHPGSVKRPVEILLQDAVDYSKDLDDEVIFLYNPFPVHVLELVIHNLITAARSKHRPMFIIYSERLNEISRTLEVLAQNELLLKVFVDTRFGQSFHVFQPRIEPALIDGQKDTKFGFAV